MRTYPVGGNWRLCSVRRISKIPVCWLREMQVRRRLWMLLHCLRWAIIVIWNLTKTRKKEAKVIIYLEKSQLGVEDIVCKEYL
jgi:hypothetical protein